MSANREKGAQQAPKPLATMTMRPSYSLAESRLPPKKAHTKGFLPPYVQYVYVDGGLLCVLPLLDPNYEPRRFSK
jgi:hypothetical protein